MRKELPISEEDVSTFERAKSQLDSLLSDMKSLSSKKPDGTLNKFKVLHINQIVATCNQLLGSEYKPFTEFDTFDDESLPSNSDVVIVLSQYIGMMDRFKFDHQFVQRMAAHWCIPANRVTNDLEEDDYDDEDDEFDDEEDDEFDDEEDDDND